MLDELRKLIKPHTIEKLSKDQISVELITTIFPELKNIKIFSKLKNHQKDHLKQIDFIVFLSLMVIDETDNLDYFLYRFNFSKNDQNRIKDINSFYKQKINSKTFSENNLNKFFYYNGRQAVIDILNFRIIKSKNPEKNLIDLVELYKDKILPTMPINADVIMKKYQIPEGKQLGIKLKMIEDEWVNNNFNISKEDDTQNLIYYTIEEQSLDYKQEEM